MNFNEATALLYKGERVRLKNWKPQSYIYLEKGKMIDNPREPQKSWFPNGMRIIAHLNCVTAKGEVIVGFTPYAHEVLNGEWEKYVGD